MKKNYPSIGIIGGAGPIAGAQLFQKIIGILQADYGCQKDSDFPYMMLLNYPFADMLKEQIDNKQKSLIRKQLSESLACLAKNEIQIIAIACNTLHEFLDIEKTSSMSLVHMINELATLIKKKQIRKPLVLCSTTSVKCQLHKNFFECFYPNQNFQIIIQDLINKILAGKQNSEDAHKFSEQLNDHLLLLQKTPGEKMGLVLGCTEFSVFNEQFPLQLYGLNHDFIVLDPHQILAERICNIIFKFTK